MIRVLVVAALPTVRAGLAALIQGDNILVSGQRNAISAGPVGAFGEPAADVLLIDPANSAEIDEATNLLPTASIVVLGPVDDESRLLDALAGRAWGYVPRDATGEQIVAAIQAVGDGLTNVCLVVKGWSNFSGRYCAAGENSEPVVKSGAK